MVQNEGGFWTWTSIFLSWCKQMPPRPAWWPSCHKSLMEICTPSCKLITIWHWQNSAMPQYSVKPRLSSGLWRSCCTLPWSLTMQPSSGSLNTETQTLRSLDGFCCYRSSCFKWCTTLDWVCERGCSFPSLRNQLGGLGGTVTSTSAPPTWSSEASTPRRLVLATLAKRISSCHGAAPSQPGNPTQLAAT